MTPSLKLVTRLTVTLAEPIAIGATGGGTREVIPITGGVLEGPLLAGHLLPGGADWCLTRADGVAEVWARYTLVTDDRTPVMVTNAGLAHLQPDGSWKGHTTPRFEVAPGPWTWLTRSIFLGILTAAADGTRVEMAWFRVG